MKNNMLLNNISNHPSWDEFVYNNENLLELENITKQISHSSYFPNTNKVFRFLENDLFNIKYIVLGMDPYPSYYIENDNIIPIATGRSFEVSNIKSWKQKFKQKSLAEILKTLYYDKYKAIISIEELRNKIIEIDTKQSKLIIENTKNNCFTVNENNYNKKTIHSYNDALYNTIKNKIISVLKLSNNDLENIEKKKEIILFNPTSFYDITEVQGVLWLNSTLTVEQNNSSSHMKIWNNYMNRLFQYIQSKNKNIKYLVFGEQAKNRIKDIIDTNHMIITCHPASRVNNDFIKSNCFKELKDILLYI